MTTKKCDSWPDHWGKSVLEADLAKVEQRAVHHATVVRSARDSMVTNLREMHRLRLTRQIMEEREAMVRGGLSPSAIQSRVATLQAGAVAVLQRDMIDMGLVPKNGVNIAFDGILPEWEAGQDAPPADTLHRMAQGQPIRPEECRIVQDVLLRGGSVDDAEKAVYDHRREHAYEAERVKGIAYSQHGVQRGASARADESRERAKAARFEQLYGTVAVAPKAVVMSVDESKKATRTQVDGWFRKFTKEKFK